MWKRVLGRSKQRLVLGAAPHAAGRFQTSRTGQEGSLLHSSPQKGLIGVTVGRRSAAEDMTHARCARATRLGRVRRRRQRHRGSWHLKKFVVVPRYTRRVCRIRIELCAQRVLRRAREAGEAGQTKV